MRGSGNSPVQFRAGQRGPIVHAKIAIQLFSLKSLTVKQIKVSTADSSVRDIAQRNMSYDDFKRLDAVKHNTPSVEITRVY